MAKTLFISYSKQDKLFAVTVADRVSALGYRPWRDDDSLPPAEDWQQNIKKALKESSALLLVLTPNSIKSRWVDFEWITANALEKPVLQLKFKPFDPKQRHPVLAALQEIDFTDLTGADPWSKLANYLKEHLPVGPSMEIVRHNLYDKPDRKSYRR